MNAVRLDRVDVEHAARSYARLYALHASYRDRQHPTPESLVEAAALVEAIHWWFCMHGNVPDAAECDVCRGIQEITTTCVYCGEKERKKMTARKAEVVTVTTPTEQMIEIGRIVADAALQARVSLNAAAVCDYAEVLDELPPVELYLDQNGAFWVGDGNHRIAAATRAGRATIKARVRRGTRRDALLHAVGANVKHGLRRSNADKRRAVRLVLDDKEWRDQSDRWTANKCGVSHPFVASLRREGDVVAAYESAAQALERLDRIPDPAEMDLELAYEEVRTAVVTLRAMSAVIKAVETSLGSDRQQSKKPLDV